MFSLKSCKHLDDIVPKQDVFTGNPSYLHELASPARKMQEDLNLRYQTTYYKEGNVPAQRKNVLKNASISLENVF